MRRFSAFICTNIAEGYKKSRKEFIRCLDILQGSVEETKYHLLLSKDLGYMEEKIYDDFIDIINQVGRMLPHLIINLR